MLCCKKGKTITKWDTSVKVRRGLCHIWADCTCYCCAKSKYNQSFLSHAYWIFYLENLWCIGMQHCYC